MKTETVALEYACGICNGTPALRSSAGRGFFYACGGCGRQTPAFNDARDAANDWNQRNIPKPVIPGNDPVSKCARCGTMPYAVDAGNGTYYLACEICGLESDASKNPQAAIAKWNSAMRLWVGDVEILSCPFCDGYGKVMWNNSAATGYINLYWIQCDKCKCRGPEAYAAAGALAGWNGRYGKVADPVPIKEPKPELPPKFMIALSQPVISLMPRPPIRREPTPVVRIVEEKELEEEEMVVKRTRFNLEKLFGDVQNRLNWFTAAALAESFGVTPGAITAHMRDLKANGWVVQMRRDGTDVMYNITKKEVASGNANQSKRGKSVAGEDEARDGLAEPAARSSAKRRSSQSDSRTRTERSGKTAPDGKRDEEGGGGHDGGRGDTRSA